MSITVDYKKLRQQYESLCRLKTHGIYSVNNNHDYSQLVAVYELIGKILEEKPFEEERSEAYNIAQRLIFNTPVDLLSKGESVLATKSFIEVLSGKIPENEIRGFIGDYKEQAYGIQIKDDHSFCSCPDFMYRNKTCKHIVALALYVIRN